MRRAVSCQPSVTTPTLCHPERAQRVEGPLFWRCCLFLYGALHRSRRLLTSRNSCHELHHLLQRGFRLIAMWRVLAIRQHNDLARGHARLDRLYLCDRAVLVILALNAQDRAAYRRQILFDVPRPKLWVEPNVVPSPEGRRSEEHTSELQ